MSDIEILEPVVELPTGIITEWNDDQWNNFKSWLTQVLRSNVVEVVFNKTDGSERVMNCTLQGNLVIIKPAQMVDQVFSNDELDNLLSLPKRKRAPPKPVQGNITVFDVDQVAWRSFRVRNITNIYSLLLKYGAP